MHVMFCTYMYSVLHTVTYILWCVHFFVVLVFGLQFTGSPSIFKYPSIRCQRHAAGWVSIQVPWKEPKLGSSLKSEKRWFSFVKKASTFRTKRAREDFRAWPSKTRLQGFLFCCGDDGFLLDAQAKADREGWSWGKLALGETTCLAEKLRCETVGGGNSVKASKSRRQSYRWRWQEHRIVVQIDLWQNLSKGILLPNSILSILSALVTLVLLRSAPGSSNGIQERVKLLLYCGRKILQWNKNHSWISSCWLKGMLHQFSCHMIRRDRRMCLGNAFRCSHIGRFLVNSKTHHNRSVFYWVNYTDLGLTSPQKIVRKLGWCNVEVLELRLSIPRSYFLRYYLRLHIYQLIME